MFRIFILFCALTLAGCSPHPETRVAPPVSNPPPSQTVAKIIKPIPQTTKSIPPAPQPPEPHNLTKSRPVAPLAYQQAKRNGTTFSIVAYDDRRHQVRVADQPNGLGSRWTTAQEAAATYGGLAAINGGFFTPAGGPLGLLIETDTKRGYLNKSSLGAGIFISNKDRSAIIRRETYTKSKDSWNAYNLLQTGPMLVENHRTISGLSKTNSRPRSFIAWDGKNHWAIGHTSACTLDQLSKALAGKSPTGFKVHTAVNLDGGRSSDLWVSGKISGGGKSHRGFFNKPVRNYLVLTKK